MNWTGLRNFLWIDTRFNFLAKTPKNGNVLDIGSSEGQTLNHFFEARQDLHFFSTDIQGTPANYPPNTQFERADITVAKLPWPDNSMDAITSMHLVEHITEFDNFFKETYRLLKPGAAIYIETPHPLTQFLQSNSKTQAGKFTYNFWDDLTHQQIVPVGKLAAMAIPQGFTVEKVGISRNLIFALSYFFSFLLSDRKKMIAKIHFIGWSSYIILKKN